MCCGYRSKRSLQEMWSKKTTTSTQATKLESSFYPEKLGKDPAEMLVNMYQTTRRHIQKDSILLKKTCSLSISDCNTKISLFNFLSHHVAARIWITVTLPRFEQAVMTFCVLDAKLHHPVTRCYRITRRTVAHDRKKFTCHLSSSGGKERL
jgi:hypothetical protein